jgi:hypothetical protein
VKADMNGATRLFQSDGTHNCMKYASVVTESLRKRPEARHSHLFHVALACLGRPAALMMTASNVRLLFIAIVCCLAVTALAEQKTVSQDGVSLTYDTTMFSKVEVIESKREPLPHPHDQLNAHPANLLFLFYMGARYAGSIALYPLEDRSVEDLTAAYPELSGRAETLRRLLHDRPALPQRYASGNPKEIPTIQNQMADQYFLSHAWYLDFLWGSGVGFLVQYSQDSSNYAVGARLRYQIEGIGARSKIAVSAYFNVSHPDLPHTEENGLVTDKNGEDLGEEAYMKYLRRMEAFLDGKSETTFRPPLDSIQKLVGSLRFENVDPTGWGSKFNGKTTVIE